MKSPKDQSVTFIELFFDLVFVFAVTQVVIYLHHIDQKTIFQAALIFWLIWWSWTQFTWSLNGADTTHEIIEILTLIATAIAFVMSVSIPVAFTNDAFWFTIPYVLTRIIGMFIQYKIMDSPEQRSTLRIWFGGSGVGLIFVLIGALVGGDLQYVFWMGTIIADLLTALYGARQGAWNLFPDHFVERHGLIIIIALGESLIVAAGGAVTESFDTDILVLAIQFVAITCSMWWLYFVKAKPLLDEAFENIFGNERALVARDSYSMFHFFILIGIIGYTLAIEEKIIHPSDPLEDEFRIALGLGLFLYSTGVSLSIWRSVKKILGPRLVVQTIVSVIIIFDLLSFSVFMLCLIGLIVIILIEEFSFPKLVLNEAGDEST